MRNGFKKSGLWLFLLLTGFTGSRSHAQNSAGLTDTVRIHAGYKMVFQDTTFHALRDTFFIFPKGTDFRIKKINSFQSDHIYERLKEKQDSSLWARGIYDLIIREQEDSAKVNPKVNLQNSRPELVSLKVGYIRIIHVDMIFENTDSLSPQQEKVLTKVLIGIHKNTRESVIRKNLTVSEGDILGAFTISDLEHHLRSLRYIEDVKVYVNRDSLQPGTVNLLVAVKDRLPFSVGIGSGGPKDLSLSVTDINFLGTGNGFTNVLHYNGNSRPLFRYSGHLSFQNIRGSFVNTNLTYTDNSLESGFVINVSRNFITPETRYGGGIETYYKKNILVITANDSSLVTIPLSTYYFDQWAGRVFLLDPVKRNSIILKARFMTTRYTHRPTVTIDSNQQYYDTNLILASLGLFRKNHYKERMLIGYGLVEDIDYGYSVEMTGGYQYGEYFKAPYAGISLKASNRFQKAFFGAGIQYGGFLYKKKISEGLLRISLEAFSPLFKLNKTHFRFLTKIAYTEGIRRYPFEEMNLGNEIRGLSNNDIKGDKRLVVRFELVSFLKWNLIGFRFSPNVFYDAAFLSGESMLLSAKNFYSGFGAGIRIRNEHLVIPTLIVRLGYYPGNSVINGHFAGSFSTSFPGSFNEYDIMKPDVLHY